MSAQLTAAEIDRLAATAVASLASSGLLQNKSGASAFYSQTKSLLYTNKSHSTSSSSSTKNDGSAPLNALDRAVANNSLYDNRTISAPPLKKEKVPAKPSAGKGWFDLAPLEMTEELKRDVKMIQMRNYMDPKR